MSEYREDFLIKWLDERFIALNQTLKSYISAHAEEHKRIDESHFRDHDDIRRQLEDNLAEHRALEARLAAVENKSGKGALNILRWAGVTFGVIIAGAIGTLIVYGVIEWAQRVLHLAQTP